MLPLALVLTVSACAGLSQGSFGYGPVPTDLSGVPIGVAGR